MLCIKKINRPPLLLNIVFAYVFGCVNFTHLKHSHDDHIEIKNMMMYPIIEMHFVYERPRTAPTVVRKTEISRTRFLVESIVYCRISCFVLLLTCYDTAVIGQHGYFVLICQIIV